MSRAASIPFATAGTNSEPPATDDRGGGWRWPATSSVVTGSLLLGVAGLAVTRAATGWESALFPIAYVALAVAAGRLLTWEPALATAWLISVAAQVPTVLAPAGAGAQTALEGTALTVVAWISLLIVQLQRDRIATLELGAAVPLFDDASRLANARALELRTASELSRARRREQPLTLLWISLQGLPGEYEGGGLERADSAVRSAGVAALTAVRGEDLVARTATRELGVLLPDAGPIESRVVASRIERALDKANATDGPLAGCFPSYGMAHFPTDGQTVDDLIDAARGAARAPRHR